MSKASKRGYDIPARITLRELQEAKRRNYEAIAPFINHKYAVKLKKESAE